MVEENQEDRETKKKEILKSVKPLLDSIKPRLEITRSIMDQMRPRLEIFKTISERIKPQLEISQRIVEAIKPQLEISKRIAESIRPQLEISRIVSENLNIIGQSYRDSLNKWFPPLFDKDFLQNLSKIAKKYNSPEFKRFSKEWGWIINKKSIPFGDYLFGLYQKHGKSKFKDKFNRIFYHKSNLETILKDVKEKFPGRYHIIKEAFHLHSQKKYSSSIILMLPQVEGILWELGMKRKIVRRGYNSEYLKGNKTQKIKLTNLSKKLFDKDKFHNIIAVDIFAEGFRNKVLHGRNIYNNKEREISRWKSTLLILTIWRLCDE